MRSKVAGIALIVGSVYYIIAEAISAAFFKASISNTYIFHTISELGIPNADSPLFWLMNSAFILIGLTLIFANFYRFRDYILRNRVIFYILTIVTGFGVIIVGLVHGGNPLTMSYHALGAVMAILGGNVLLMIVSRSMDGFGRFQKATLVLGIIGFAAFWIMFFGMDSIWMPVFERLSVYTLVIWSFLAGIFLLNN